MVRPGTSEVPQNPENKHWATLMKANKFGALRLLVVATIVLIALWDGWILLAVTAANFQGNPVAVLLGNTVIPTLLALALLTWLLWGR